MTAVIYRTETSTDNILTGTKRKPNILIIICKPFQESLFVSSLGNYGASRTRLWNGGSRHSAGLWMWSPYTLSGSCVCVRESSRRSNVFTVVVS